MRLIEFEDNKNHEDEILQLLKDLRTTGSSAIESMKKVDALLYRGVSNEHVCTLPFFTAESPNNRLPLGQTLTSQQKLDEILKLNNFKALRTNSICCIADFEYIRSFGTPYIIFPHNGFDFTWSRKISDIGSNNWLRSTLTTSKYKIINYKNAKEFNKFFKFENTDLAGALDSMHEISIHGKYTAISGYYVDMVVKELFGY